MGADEFGRCTMREYYHLWNRRIEELNLLDSEFALTRALMVNLQIGKQSEQFSPEDFKLIKVVETVAGQSDGQKRIEGGDGKVEDWQILQASLMAYTAALAKRSQIVQVKVKE